MEFMEFTNQEEKDKAIEDTKVLVEEKEDAVKDAETALTEAKEDITETEGAEVSPE
jgi:fructose-specific component phosphotransferase system IIB-like protein